MPLNADQVADKGNGGAELYRLSQLYKFPAFVKKANPDQVLARRTAAQTIYADPVRRQFPCDSAASTWLSALFYQEKRAEFHPKDQRRIERLLDQYTSYWRIKEAVDQIRGRWTELHKTAEEQLPDSAYAYVWVGEDGRKERHCRLSNAVEVKAAAEWLEKYRDRLPFRDRHTIATKILEKASSYGAAVGDHMEFLERQAGRGVCDPAEVVEQVEKRAYLTTKPDLREAFVTMARTLRDKPRQAMHPSNLVKLAETIDTLDRQILNVGGRYADYGLVRPEELVFKATFAKVAGDLQRSVATTNGKVYEKGALGKLAVADLRALFGDEFAGKVSTPLGDVDVEKMAEELSALPRPDAQALEALLSEHGVVPVLHKAASAGAGLSRAEIEALADQYASQLG
jgi:hypothetical protein